MGRTTGIRPAMNRFWLKPAAILFAIAHLTVTVGCVLLWAGGVFLIQPDPYVLWRTISGYVLLVLLMPLGFFTYFFPPLIFPPLIFPLLIVNSIYWGVMFQHKLQEWADGPLQRDRLLPQRVDLPAEFGDSKPTEAEQTV